MIPIDVIKIADAYASAIKTEKYVADGKTYKRWKNVRSIVSQDEYNLLLKNGLSPIDNDLLYELTPQEEYSELSKILETLSKFEQDLKTCDSNISNNHLIIKNVSKSAEEELLKVGFKKKGKSLQLEVPQTFLELYLHFKK